MSADETGTAPAPVATGDGIPTTFRYRIEGWAEDCRAEVEKALRGYRSPLCFEIIEALADTPRILKHTRVPGQQMILLNPRPLWIVVEGAATGAIRERCGGDESHLVRVLTDEQVSALCKQYADPFIVGTTTPLDLRVTVAGTEYPVNASISPQYLGEAAWHDEVVAEIHYTVLVALPADFALDNAELWEPLADGLAQAFYGTLHAPTPGKIKKRARLLDRKGYAHAADLTDTVARSGRLLTVNAEPVYMLREAVFKGNFRRAEDSPYPTALVRRNENVGRIQLIPQSGDEDTPQVYGVPEEQLSAWAASMWELARQKLGDRRSDVLDVAIAFYLLNGTPDGDVELVINDALSLLGKKKKLSRGRAAGYRLEDKEAFYGDLAFLANLWVDMIATSGYDKKRKRPPEAMQSRAIVITDRLGQLRTDGSLDVRSVILRPGRIFRMFLNAANVREYALLDLRAVQYDPYRQSWEKRILKYLSWNWRCNFRNGPVTRLTVERLLEVVGEEIDTRQPSRTLNRLEKALDKLEDDKAIRGWQYDGWDKLRVRARDWHDAWKKTCVLIETPDHLQQHYEKTVPQAKERQQRQQLACPQKKDLPELVRETRRALGLSQMQAAEAVGICQSSFSRIESGKRKPSKAEDAKIRQWIQQHRPRVAAGELA